MIIGSCECISANGNPLGSIVACKKRRGKRKVNDIAQKKIRMAWELPGGYGEDSCWLFYRIRQSRHTIGILALTVME